MSEFTADLIDAAELTGARRLKVTGSIRIQHGPELKAAIMHAMAGGSGVVLDLNGVTDVDLSGLQCICAAHRMSIARQQPFSVCREDNQIIAAMAQAAGYFRHTGCAQDTGHTCIWATGGKQ